MRDVNYGWLLRYLHSNGAAFFFENRIEIWARPLDYDLRGSHRWMQGVISHEFTHIVQLGKSMKYNPKINDKIAS